MASKGGKYELNRRRNNCIFKIGKSKTAIIDATTHRLRKVQLLYSLSSYHYSTEYHPNGQIRYHLYIEFGTRNKNILDFCYFSYDDKGAILSYRDFYGNEWKIEWGVDFPFTHGLTNYYRVKRSTDDLIELNLRKYRMFTASIPSEVTYASKIINTLINKEKKYIFDL
jgi:hypothetical protein